MIYLHEFPGIELGVPLENNPELAHGMK